MQTVAWKAGHKHLCCAPGQGAAAAQIQRAARKGAKAQASCTSRALAGITVSQDRLVTRLFELHDADDWRGVMAIECKAQALARELRGADPGLAGDIYSLLGRSFEQAAQNQADKSTATLYYGWARDMYEQIKAIAEELGNLAVVARSCSGLGNCYENMGDYGRAREMHEQRKAMDEELGDRKGVARACHNLGNCHENAGDYARARKMHEQHKTICEELGDREGVATACSNLGNYYQRTGAYVMAREMHEQDKEICEALGNREGVAAASGNLGACYHSMRNYGRAHELFEQHRAMAEELGNREGVATATGNLGMFYLSTEDYGSGREIFEQHKAMAEELGDRAGVGRACGNLGNCYRGTGDYGLACEMYEQHKAIAEELGDLEGLACTCKNLGNCMISTGEYMKAISYFQTQFDIGRHIWGKQSLAWEAYLGKASLGMGVAMRLHVRADRQAASASKPLILAAGASHLPGPRSSASASLEDRVKEAETFLKAAFAARHGFALLHLAHLTYDADQKAKALAYLTHYLDWCVETGRARCDSCRQVRGEDAPMLTCSGCRVARFCSADHQKKASKRVSSGGSVHGRHKDICGLLGKWRAVGKDGVSANLTADLLEFLRKAH